MRTFHHTPVCLPRVSPILIQLDGQITSFHSVCAPQDETPLVCHLCRTSPAPATQSAFSDGSGVVGSPSFHISVHARLKGHLRRHLLQQVVVHRRSGHVPVAGDQPDGAGDVSVPRVGTKRRSQHAPGIRGDDTQGFRRCRSLPYLHPPIDKEVDAATHRQPLRGTISDKSVTFIWTTVSVATQVSIPSPQPFHSVHHSPHHPRYAVRVIYTIDIPSVVGVATHPTRNRRLHRQDRVGVVVARSRKGGCYNCRSLKKQDVRCCFSFCVVIQPYCSSLYSPRTVVLKTIPTIVYSPPTQLSPVARRIFKDLSIPYPGHALGWATWSRWRRTTSSASSPIGHHRIF